MELADAGPAGEVVHPHGAAQGSRHLRVDQPVLGEERDEEREQAHQMGGVAPEPLPLPQGLVHEADVAVLQVPQAPVDELRALRRGAAGEVVALHQRRAQATRRSVERHPRPGDPAADHEHVEGRVAQRLQGTVAIEGAERHALNLVGTGRPPACGAGTDEGTCCCSPAPWRWWRCTCGSATTWRYPAGLRAISGATSAAPARWEAGAPPTSSHGSPTSPTATPWCWCRPSVWSTTPSGCSWL